MKKIIAIILLISMTSPVLALWPYQQKPMLGRQVDHSSIVGDQECLWLMNEGSGNTVFDLSGNGNTGTLNGTALSWISGQFGTSLDLPGTNEYIDLGSSLHVDFLTFAIWIQPRVINFVGDNVVSSDNMAGNLEWQIFANTGADTLRIRVDTAGSFVAFNSNTSFVAGVWYFLALTFDGTTAKFYVNGVLDNSAVQGSPGVIRTSGNNRFIGSYPTISNFFNGGIDTAMPYDRALTPSEIGTLFREPFTFMQGDLPVTQMFYFGGAPAEVGQLIFISTTPLILLAGCLIWLNRKKVAFV